MIESFQNGQLINVKIVVDVRVYSFFLFVLTCAIKNLSIKTTARKSKSQKTLQQQSQLKFISILHHIKTNSHIINYVKRMYLLFRVIKNSEKYRNPSCNPILRSYFSPVSTHSTTPKAYITISAGVLLYRRPKQR
jgi:hypothetical protein